MKKIEKIPLPESLEPFAALILYLQFKKDEERMKPRKCNVGHFLAEAANSSTVSADDVMPWLLIFTEKNSKRCFEV